MDDFKETFKYFKQKHDPKLLHNVIDFELQNPGDRVIPLTRPADTNDNNNTCASCTQLCLLPHQQWSTYTIDNLNGLYFIKNPFTVQGQQKWIRKCLESYPRKPSVTNLDLHYKSLDDVWSLREDSDPMKCKLVDKLSWVTFGYHHNWDSKVYDHSHYSPFPDCLAELSMHIASCFHFRTFKPEAAIVNYYNSKSSLGIHNDHSEIELSQPIISISFGQGAIFLVGTESRTEKPVATYLKSGDIVLLSGPSRLAYHAVPAVVQETVCDRYCASDEDPATWKPFEEYIQKHRINISVRQVYPNNHQVVRSE